MRATIAIAGLVFTWLAATDATAGVTYTYDALGRLYIARYDNNKQITYNYDPAGNRTLVVTGASTPHAALKISKNKKKGRTKSARHH